MSIKTDAFKSRMNNLSDPAAERIILSSIMHYGSDVFFDILLNIHDHDFCSPENQLIFQTFKKLIVEDNIKIPDQLSIIGKINSIDPSLLNKYQIADYLSAIYQDKILQENIKPFVQRVARLGLSRNLILKMQSSIEELKNTTGEESFLEIINKAEKPISDFTTSLIQEEEISNLGDEVLDYINQLSEEKPTIQGIPSGFPLYDHYIGGGFRKGGVHVLGGRAKVGKSFFGLNVAHYVSSQNIPVLYLDTELNKQIFLGRWSSRVTDVPTNIIETGQFIDSPQLNSLVMDRIKSKSKKTPFYYFNISGRDYQEWISIMRRWIMRIVKFDDQGNVNPCLIVVDYIKMMDLRHIGGNFQEYQYLGQMMTDLHNFAARYNIPVFAPVQLNRDGINKDDQSIFAGSDRIIQLCSSASFIRNKDNDDYVADPQSNGNKKLVIIAGRFGPGTQDGEYINLKCDLSKAQIIEGRTNLQNRRQEMSLVDNNDNNVQVPIEI